MKIKLRKIVHRFKKFFGFPEDKWARGGGRLGYRRSYGKNKTGSGAVDLRTRAELRDTADRRDAQEEIEETT